jgi:chloramphenicol 3-O-phosphotransferase
LQNVRENVDCLRNILVECFGVVDGLFTGCVGVEVSTEVLDFKLEVGLRTAFCAFESEVLE